MLWTWKFFNVVTGVLRLSQVTDMVRELSDTGHWYYCANVHPFTIGEKRAVQEAVCPKCGAGVTQADALGQQLRGWRCSQIDCFIESTYS